MTGGSSESRGSDKLSSSSMSVSVAQGNSGGAGSPLTTDKDHTREFPAWRDKGASLGEDSDGSMTIRGYSIDQSKVMTIKVQQ